MARTGGGYAAVNPRPDTPPQAAMHLAAASQRHRERASRLGWTPRFRSLTGLDGQSVPVPCLSPGTLRALFRLQRRCAPRVPARYALRAAFCAWPPSFRGQKARLRQSPSGLVLPCPFAFGSWLRSRLCAPSFLSFANRPSVVRSDSAPQHSRYSPGGSSEMLGPWPHPSERGWPGVFDAGGEGQAPRACTTA